MTGSTETAQKAETTNTPATPAQAQPAVPGTENKGVPIIGPAGEPAKNVDDSTVAYKEVDKSSLVVEVRPHAFIVMPFGKKKGGDGSLYDFNAIYKQLIKPALEEAGFEPFRADEETASGDILTDMFQELLLADLVLCDLSIDNANAFYELGIRHAFRKRGVMHIQAGRAYMPFDIFNVRTLPYHVTPDGVPDAAFLKTDIQAIARMAKDTWASDRDAIHSPIFNLLQGLKEPERKSLRTPLATGFWREYNEWKQRVTVAQRQKRIGDILLLTEEISNPLIKEEAIGEAGNALANMGRNELALVQYRKGLEVNSGNLDFRRKEAFHLNRLGRVDEAIVKIESLLTDFPNDSEAISYLGRIYKEMWADSWKQIPDKNKRLKAAFDAYHWLIKAIDTYLKGYRIDLNNHYPGVNALTLSSIAIHLADKFDDKKDPDPDITRIRDEFVELKGALIFALEKQVSADNADYWTLISLAELRALTADNTATVVRSYRKALTASRRNMFFLQASLSQLEILKALDMRTTFVEAGISILDEEIARISGDKQVSAAKGNNKNGRAPEGQVFLFAGYMIDYPGKNKKTFPANRERDIREDIEKLLTKFNAGPGDIAILAGLSAGSEILFAEVCAEKGIHVNVHLPLPESRYIREFVSIGGEQWVDRFYKICSHPDVDEFYQLEQVGSPKKNGDPYERNNRWALYSSLVRGISKTTLIAVWNNVGGRAKDRDEYLTQHMVDLMRETGGKIEAINTTKYLFEGTAVPANATKPPAPKKSKSSKK
ncbi:MAG TPA: TRAFs-binding domain-containing protein [Anaerolineales bacterium]|nr:TRAFs-binding domain-containing protein [Anaerolineales bacterium]